MVQKFMHDKLNIRQFFSNFMISRLMMDHTFIFPRLGWVVGLLALLFFGYSPLVIMLSIFMLYVLYVAYGLMNYASALILLKDFPDERHYLRSKWWVALTMPIYNGFNTMIRLVGIMNTMTRRASWQTYHFKDEMSAIKKTFLSDLKKLREGRKRSNEG